MSEKDEEHLLTILGEHISPGAALLPIPSYPTALSTRPMEDMSWSEILRPAVLAAAPRNARRYSEPRSHAVEAALVSTVMVSAASPESLLQGKECASERAVEFARCTLDSGCGWS